MYHFDKLHNMKRESRQKRFPQKKNMYFYKEKCTMTWYFSPNVLIYLSEQVTTFQFYGIPCSSSVMLQVCLAVP